MKNVVGALILAACGTTGSGGNGGPGGGGGWTAMPLMDEASVQRADNDLVTGIYFASADDGYVVTQGDMQSAGEGGAVFKTSATSVKSLAFSGKDGGPSESGGVDFVGLQPTPSGIAAFAYSADLVQSTDHGATFAIAKNGNLAGIEPLIGFQETASGTTVVRETGVVSTSTGAPGPTASYTDVWAPNGDPPTPNPVPSNMCQGGPLGAGVPIVRSTVYVSSDRMTIAYTSAPAMDPQICLSHDGGQSFTPVLLQGISNNATTPPDGIVYANATTAITFWATSTYPGESYIQRSTDGGATWTSVAVPSDVASHGLDLKAGFFAPDGTHGWLVGYDYDASKALVLATTDGGATWATEAIDSENKLYTGFALDATHVWVGGAAGTLLAKQ